MRIGIWDNGGKTIDRYTVVIGRAVYGMSLHPTDPQGFNQYSHTLEKGVALSPPKDWGKKIPFEKLPGEVQVAIAGRMVGLGTGEHLT